MAYVFLGVTAPSSTLQQDVLVLVVALAVFALFLPILMVAQAAREAPRKGQLLEDLGSKALSLPPSAGADVKTARQKKRKVRKHGKTATGRPCGQQGLSDSDDVGAALESASSGSEAAPLIPASAPQVELQEAESNELLGVVEHQQSDELHAKAKDSWQPSVWRNGIKQQLPTEIEQETEEAIVPGCAKELPMPQEAEEPQFEPEKVAESIHDVGPEWGRIEDRRYGRMVFLLHRQIRAETLRRCPPGLQPLQGSLAAMMEEPAPHMRGLSTRRLTLWP